MDTQKNYEFKESEKKWLDYWENKKLFYLNFKKIQETDTVYSIDTPPPTVSGKMHIGHAFSYSQGDMIVRYRRMKGEKVFYPFGTDDNGLPTEKLVEKLKKVNSKAMTRQEFIELCEATIKEIKPDFILDWKKIGVSAEFQNSYSTIEPRCIKTAQKSFIDLYKKGRIYQEESPVSWCVHCQTAIAQAEFDNVEMTSHFNDIVFKSGVHELIIATTRPELIPACVAIAAHPDDDRYKNLKGKTATVPLFNYDVPIIFDETVALDKGSGLMMVCTFGDKEDIEKWYKHKLPLKTAINPNGTMNHEAGKYEGLTIKDMRKQILEDLKKENLLLVQKSIVHAVNVHERCGTEIEILKTKQWFIRVLDKKQELVEAADQINWHPQFMKKRYVNWVENLQWDWCISRQRFFGVPFPVWHSKKTGEIILADESQIPIDPLKDSPKKLPAGHTAEDILPETDVMDTWMTSSNTPQIALNWAEDPDTFKKFYPESTRLQSHDIIRTWAFYTIVKGIYNNGNIPWKNIIISGFVLDPKGKKMSKSKGNVIAPQEILDKYGADTMRFWAAGSKLGDDLPYQEKDVLTGKKTVTKIWNASKFTIMNLEEYLPTGLNAENLEIIDKWLLSKLMSVVKASTDAFESYEYSKSKQETDNFFWQKFCDNYLEFIKHRTYGENINPESKRAAQDTLYFALLTQLKLFAPIMPFITEEVYQQYFKEFEKDESIHISKWPSYNSKLVDEEAEKAGDLAVAVVSEIRKHKSINKQSLKVELESITISCTKDQEKLLKLVETDILRAGVVKNIKYESSEELKVSF